MLDGGASSEQIDGRNLILLSCKERMLTNAIQHSCSLLNAKQVRLEDENFDVTNS